MQSVAKIRSVADAEYFARRRLPKVLAQAIEFGEPGPTFGRNLEAFSDVYFRTHVGVSHPRRDTSTTVLGHTIAQPVIVAPTGNIRMHHIDGEPGAARACGAAATIHCVSAFSGYAIEDITAAATGPVFFGLYFLGGRANVEAMIDRARRAGCAALILTLDSAAPPLARRHVSKRAFLPLRVNIRNAISFLPQAIVRPAWLRDFLRDREATNIAMVRHLDGRAMTLQEARVDVSREVPVWEDMCWIREQWRGPIIVKGILTADDARRAVDEGASAVVVSNHGGHMLPSTPPTLRALPDVLEAVGDQVEVLLDGGIRCGEDVVKAVALGARAVLIGRAYLWAHAAAGEAGIRRILQVFATEIDQTLGLIGCPSVQALDASWVTQPPRLVYGDATVARV